MSPQDYCRAKTGGSGSSFYYSFLFLPPDRREAITALYAFCREVDDVVDESTQPEVARAALAWWRDEIARLLDGTPTHPVTRALRPAIAAYALPRAPFLDILDGMQMDLDAVRYASFDDLLLYCRRVASTVGVLSARVFGFTRDATLEFARNLGIAFQLTNIIRDVGEDARRGRIYLPLEDLERFNVPTTDILTRRGGERFCALMEFETKRALHYYDTAMAALPAADRRAQTPSLAMAAIYRRTLDEIRADGFRVLTHKLSLTALRKLWIAWRTARREARWAG